MTSDISLDNAFDVLKKTYKTTKKVTQDKGKWCQKDVVLIGPVIVTITEVPFRDELRYRVSGSEYWGKPFRLVKKADKLVGAVKTVWGELMTTTRRANEKERAEKSERRKNAKALKGTGFRMDSEDSANRKFGGTTVNLTLDNGQVTRMSFGLWTSVMTMEDFKRVIIPALKKVLKGKEDEEHDE